MKALILFFTTTLFLFSIDISPSKVFPLKGNSTDFKIVGTKAYVTTDAGVLEIFDIEKEKKIEEIQLENIKNFFDEIYPPKIFGVDVIGEKILLVSEDGEGGRNIFEIINREKKLVLNSRDKKLSIREVKYLNENEILIALTYSDFLLLDITSTESLYRNNFSISTFSDFSFNNDRSQIALTDESGKVYIYNTINGDEIKVLDGANKDNVYKLDFKSGKIITAGQDREVGIYNAKSGEYKTKKADFLIYSSALSQDGKFGAYIKNEQNQIEIIQTDNLKSLYTLIGHNSTVNTIFFKNNNEVYSSSDDKNFIKWIIK